MNVHEILKETGLLGENNLIKSKQLRRGDSIAVVSPSGGAAKLFPNVLKSGVRFIENEYGFKVKEYPTTKLSSIELYKSPQVRANDINNAFLDKEVSAIFVSIGGSDSVRILEYLDVEHILANPKMIMGYSDATTLLCYLNLKGLVTFHGSSVMAGMSYLINFDDAREEYKKVLLTNSLFELKPFQKWAQEYQNWNEEGNESKVKEIFENNSGHHWISKGNKSIGKLWGGCIEILQMMNGTFAWPKRDFWNDKVLFLETSEDKPTPSYVGYFLRNLGVQGVLQQVKGILIARPKLYTNEEKKELEEVIVDVVKSEFTRDQINIITNLDIGHTDPRHILPYGIDLELDPKEETLIFQERFFEGE